MDGWLRQSTAVTVPIGPFIDDADGNTEETGLTIAQADVLLSKNGAASAQKNNATSASHDADGVYLCPLSTTDTNTLGQIVLWVHVAGALFVKQVFQVVPANVWDSMFGSDLLQVDSREFAGVTAVSGAIPAVAAGANGGLPLGNAAGAVTLASATHTGAVIPTVTTLTNAPSDSSGVTTLLSRLPAGLFTGLTNFAHWLGALAGKQAANATAQTEIRASGAGSGTYDPTTDSLEALKDDQMTATELENAVLDAVLADHLDAGSVGAGINSASSAGDPWATALPGAYGAGTAGKIVGDNLNATVSSRATPAQVATELGTYDGPTNAEMVARTLAAADYATAAALTTVEGKIDTIDNLLDTEIGSIITSLGTIAGYLDTEIAAILADTNELQTDWANGGRLDLLIDGITTLATAIKATTDLLPDSGALSSLATTALFTSTTRNDPAALSGALAAGLTPLAKLDWILARVMRENSFNKTTGEEIVENSSGTPIAKATAADDGTTTTRGAFGAP